MGRSLSALAALAVLFTLLWAPIGQQAFLAEHWMKIGTFAAPMLLFMALTNRGPDAGPWLGDPKLMATLLLCSYLLHQFEEHWVDLLGRLYPLRDMLNEMLAKYAGDAARGAMSGEAIFYINTGVVWLVGFLGIWRAPDHLFPSLAMAGVMIVNAVFHVLNTVADHAYNPGLATGLILFLPLSLAYATALVRAGRVGVAVVLAGILWGFLGHVVLFGGLLASQVAGLAPIEVYYAVLILYALTPLAMFRRAGQAQSARGL